MAQGVEAMTGSSGSIDWEHVRDLRDELGPEEFSEVIALFLEETEQMVEALAGLDPAEYPPALHALKGAALNLGFVRLARLCADGEAAARRAEEVVVPKILTGFATSRAELRARLAQYSDE